MSTCPFPSCNVHPKPTTVQHGDHWYTYESGKPVAVTTSKEAALAAERLSSLEPGPLYPEHESQLLSWTPSGPVYGPRERPPHESWGVAPAPTSDDIDDALHTHYLSRCRCCDV